MLFLLLAQFWTSLPDPSTILQGVWETCLQDDGKYAERVYDHYKPDFELHLGPYDEFAIFVGVQDEHREHNTLDNLLKDYRIADLYLMHAAQTWEIPSLKLRLEVRQAGAPKIGCESYFIALKVMR